MDVSLSLASELSTSLDDLSSTATLSSVSVVEKMNIQNLPQLYFSFHAEL